MNKKAFSTPTEMFTFVIISWLALMAVFSFIGYFSVNAPSELNEDNLATSQGTKTSFTGLTFVFRMMFFSLPPEYQVPAFVPIVMWAYTIFALYVIIQTVNPFGNA